MLVMLVSSASCWQYSVFNVDSWHNFIHQSMADRKYRYKC